MASGKGTRPDQDVQPCLIADDVTCVRSVLPSHTLAWCRPTTVHLVSVMPMPCQVLLALGVISNSHSAAELPPAAQEHESWLSHGEHTNQFNETKKITEPPHEVDLMSFPKMKDFELEELYKLKQKAAIVQQLITEDSKNGGVAMREWPSIIQQAAPGIPAASDDLKGMLLCLVMRCWRNRKVCIRNDIPMHQWVEGFAGQAMISLHLLMAGLPGKRLDIDYSPDHDIVARFDTWLNAWSRSPQQAFHWTAPKCSSFVILCRGPSQRREENSWWGDERKEWVQQGNKIMVRTALLGFLSHLVDCTFVIEQPCNSVMFKAPPMSTVLAVTGTSRINTWHNAFGAESPKPFTLVGNLPLNVLEVGLKRKKATTPSIRLVNKKGTKFSGNKNLTKSQAYTPAFGKAVASMWCQYIGLPPR